MIFFVFVILSFGGCFTMIAGEKCERPKNGMRFRNCCTIPKLIDIPMVMQCTSHLPANFTFFPNPRGLVDMSASGKKIPDMSCFVKCIFTNQGVIRNSQPDRDALIAVLATKVNNNPDASAMFSNAVDACMGANAKPMFDKLLERVRQTAACEPEAAALVRCIMINVLKECPNSKVWQSSEECSQIKSYVNDCVIPKISGDGVGLEDLMPGR